MDIGTANAKSGELSRGYVEVTRLPTGGAEKLPVLVADGTEDGPTLWVVGTIHGDEVTSLAAAQEFAHEVRPTELAGRVVCLPNANPAGLRRNRRTSYYHCDDPNRYFPDADADSTRPPRVQEVIDRRLFESITDSADAVVSLHTSWVGSSSYVIRPRVAYGEDRTRARAEAIEERLVELTEAFGLPVINQFGSERAASEQLHRSLAGAVVSEAGIPAFTPELGGRYAVEDDARRLAVEGLKNVLRAMGMSGESPRTDPRVAPPMEPPLKRAVHPYTDTPGIVRYRVAAGDVIEEGDPVADVVTPHGDRKVTVRTDYDGYVLSRHEGAVAYENDPLLDLAVPDDEPLVVSAESDR